MSERYDDEPCDNGNDHSKTVPVEVEVQWSNENVIDGVVGKVAGWIYKDLKPQVEEAVTAMLNDRVNEAILEVVNRTVQETNKYGEPKGEPSTILELLMRDTEVWMTEKVDSQGRTGTSYNQKPRINWLLTQALNGTRNNRGGDLHDMIVKAIKNQVGDVTEIVDNYVAAAVKARFT